MNPTPDPLFAQARVTYVRGAFEEGDLTASPLAQFRRWYDDAVAEPLPEPNAMVVATVDPQGLPATRTVLLKDVTPAGLAFFTNRESRKGEHLANNPAVALTFPWFAMSRQVGVRGVAEPLGADENATYFASRPWASRVGAWASAQSRPIAGREQLQARFDDAAARFPDRGGPDDVPLPPFWGGYRVRAVEVEFWQGRPSRLHDRLVFVARAGVPALLDDPAAWAVERRQP